MAQASIFSSQQALILVPTQLYMKNYQIKNWTCFVAFFFFPLGCIELTSFVPFVLMLMMHRFGPFRERERELVKVTREWRKKRENFMAYFLVFGLFCFHVAFIHGIHPY